MLPSNSSVSQFHCQLCNKILSSKYNLKQHQNIHTGLRPYQCDFPGCESDFKHGSQLSQHKALHKEPVISRKDQFYDLKAFVMLLLEMFDRQDKKTRTREETSFAKERIILPLITSEKVISKIPLAQELTFSNK